MNWTPRTWAGVGLLALITAACVGLLYLDHNLTPAWALLGQVVQVIAKMAGAG